MIFYLLTLLALAAWITQIIYTAYKPNLRNVPGPWLAKFTNLWRVYYAWRGDYTETLRKLHRQYGDVVRVGPNCVLLSGKGQMEKILGFKEDFPKVCSVGFELLLLRYVMVFV
jgi:hypothetical protein